LFQSIAWLICSPMSLEVVLREPLGLPIGFPLFPFLNGILYRLVYNRNYAHLFYIYDDGSVERKLFLK